MAASPSLCLRRIRVRTSRALLPVVRPFLKAHGEVVKPFLKALGKVLTVDSEGLLALWDESFEWPVARFWPPFVQVIGAIWLGLPDDRLRDLGGLFGFGKTDGQSPDDTVIILVAIILSTLYGSEYGHRLQADISVAAADTGAQSARTDAAKRDRDAERSKLEATKSFIRDRIAAIDDPAEQVRYRSILSSLE